MAMSQKEALEKMTNETRMSMRQSEEVMVKNLLGLYDEYTRAVNNDISAMYNQYFEDGDPDYSLYKQYQIDKKMGELIQQRLQELSQKINYKLNQNLIDTWKEAYARNAWILDQTTPPNIKVSWAVPPDPFLNTLANSSWQGSMFSQRIGSINDVAARDIQTVLDQAVLQGKSAREAGKEIRDLVGISDDDTLITRPRAGRVKWRADMIARTELLRMSNIARQQLFDENSDVVEDQEWVAFSDFRICDDCIERNGHTYDEIVDIADEQELDVDPPCHPHCRCTWAPIVKSWEDLLGKEWGKGMDAFDKEPDGMYYQEPGTETVKSITPVSFETWSDNFLS